jgi:hypothetical protein
MARLTFARALTLTVLWAAPAVPLSAQESSVPATPASALPHGQAPDYDWLIPHSGHYQRRPAGADPYSSFGASEGSASSDTSSVSTSVTNSGAGPAAGYAAPIFETQPPEMATPTFVTHYGAPFAEPSPQAAAPNMIGDLFGTSFDATGISNLAAAPGGMVGRQKISENSSPMPRDRVFINYSYFHNTPLGLGGVDVNRLTPGFEKTFLGGDISVEVRAPFATTLDSDLIAGGPTDSSNFEFGNLTIFLKTLLWDAGDEAISAGIGFTVPTADDVTVRDINGTRLLEIENNSVHILPFIGALFMPTEKCFFQAFVQADIDPHGNSVRSTTFAGMVPTGTLVPVGRPNDSNYIFVDVGLGYWIYRAPCYGACGCGYCDQNLGWGLIRGIAPTVELHYNGSFNEADTLLANGGGGTIVLGDGERTQIDLLNLVLGVTFECYHNANLTVGYATPLAGDDDEQFDSEFRVMFNWYFGGPERVTSCGRHPF